MASEINPPLTPTKSLDNFRFWCQKVLPLVYDDSLSYYEVLGKMVVQLNDVIDDVNADTENVLTLKDAFLDLQTYVNEFFDDIDQLASYAERAEAAQTAANTSAINASDSATNASASSLAAMDARDAAVTAKQAAETSANTASTAATNANTKANEAAQSAITAQTAQASASQSATLAATDRSAAQIAASTATTKANEANTSATNAETSAENAAQSESNAEELVNNIQENLDNIQQNTKDISDLKESTNDLKSTIIQLRTENLAQTDPSQFFYFRRYFNVSLTDITAFMYCPNLSTSSKTEMGFLYGIIKQDDTYENILIESNAFTLIKNNIQWVIYKFEAKIYKNLLYTKTTLYSNRGKQEKVNFAPYADNIKGIATIGCYTNSGSTANKDFYWWLTGNKLPLTANISGVNNPPVNERPVIPVSSAANNTQQMALTLENI